MRRIAVLLLLLLASLAGPAMTADESEPRTQAVAAFEKLKSLVGRWEATNREGKKVQATYELVSDNSALLERYIEEGSYSMVTVYHLDGDRVLLTHYCGAKNQPRMQATSLSPDGTVLTFTFLDITNLSNPNQGHMHKVVHRFLDQDHFSTEWTWREEKKDKFTEVFRFERR